MDCTHDQLADGRRFRTLNIVDDLTREIIAIKPGTSMPGSFVTRILDHIAKHCDLPRSIVVDNRPEFSGKALHAWSPERGVNLQFIEPGKPMQNACIESFNGQFRDECLNQHWMTNLRQARHEIASRRHDYNTTRPDSSLGNRIPCSLAGLQNRWQGRSQANLKVC